MSSFFQDGSAEIIEKWKMKLEDAGVPVIVGSNDSSEPRGGTQLNSDIFGGSASYPRHLVFFSLKSVFVATCIAMLKKQPTVCSRALCSKPHSRLEFGPVGFGSAGSVYMSRKEELGLTLMCYSAKEFCLVVVYTVVLTLTVLLWLSEI